MPGKVRLHERLTNILLIHRFNHTAFRDDAADEPRGRDIERRVVDCDAVRGRLSAETMGDFGGGALFDGNLVAGGEGEIEGGGGGGHVERDAVGVGEDGDAVGADFVGGVAVGGDPV